MNTVVGMVALVVVVGISVIVVVLGSEAVVVLVGSDAEYRESIVVVVLLLDLGVVVACLGVVVVKHRVVIEKLFFI